MQIIESELFRLYAARPAKGISGRFEFRFEWPKNAKVENKVSLYISAKNELEAEKTLHKFLKALYVQEVEKKK